MAAFSIYVTTPEGPAIFPFIILQVLASQYSTVVHNILMLASLKCYQVKGYHHHGASISLQLHPDFLYVVVWRHEKFFLYCI